MEKDGASNQEFNSDLEITRVCPFCQGQDTEILKIDDNYQVICKLCKSYAKGFPDLPSAIFSWNQVCRTTNPSTGEIRRATLLGVSLKK